MNNRGTQHAQMQGSQVKVGNTLDTGNFPWILMAVGDTYKDGLAKI